MISASTTDGLFIVAWAFEVKPEHQRAFEQAYGQHGDWVRLFRTGDGYIKTELHRDPKNTSRYITLDFWRSGEQYESFRGRAASSYREIDAKCEQLTEKEQLLGDFADLASLYAAFPQLGSETKVGPACLVRAAKAEDLPEIKRLEESTASAAHWPPEAYADICRSDVPSRMMLVAENAEHRLCAFVVARIVADECELENIVVNAAESRQGIASTLLQELPQAARSQGAKRIFLEVRESNSAARGLYEKFGFHRDGERGAYYSDPIENAILYSLTL
jgi:[ribosomal protein S18]-alanine N-acetyltransferase